MIDSCGTVHYVFIILKMIDTKVSVSIKKTNANKCTIKRDIFI